MDTLPKLNQVNGLTALLAFALDYSGVLERASGNMGVGINAALSSAIAMFIINISAKNSSHKEKLFTSPIMGAVYSGVIAEIMVRVLGNNIQNTNLLGATGAFLGTYGAVESQEKSA